MRLAAVALCLMAALTPLQAAAAKHADRAQIMQTALAAPQGGDDFMFRLAFHKDAQNISDGMFKRLAPVLGGQAPTLNFPTDVGADGFHSTADVAGNGINLDPQIVQWLIDGDNTFHSSAVNTLPHEMAHLRQTPQVLASVPDREGGAQAFADLVTPIAAAAAGVHYDAGNYDGPYTDYAAQARARGPAWILGQQFGHPAPPWP